MPAAVIWAAAVLAACVLFPFLVVRPVWGLYPLLVVLTLIPPRGVVSILDYSLMPVDLYVMVYTLLWLWHKGFAGASIRRSPLLLPIALVVFVRFLSVFVTPGLFVGSLISFLRYVEWLLVFLIVVDVARSRDATRLLMVFLIAVGAQSLLSVAQASLSVFTRQVTISRGGTLGEVGLLLGWLQVCAMLIGFSLSHRARQPWTRMAWWVYTVVVGVGLISTLGRTAWITALIGLLAYQWLDYSTSRAARAGRIVPYLLTAGVVLAVIFAINPDLLGVAVLRAATFGSLGETFAWLERLTLWRVGLQMFVQHPILGVGTGNYVDLLGGIVGAEEARTTHNAVIGVLSETGLVGFLVYLVFVFRVVAMVRRDLRTSAGSDLYPLLLPLGSAIVALLVVDWIAWTSFLVWSVLLLGLFVVLAREASPGSSHERASYANLLSGQRG